MRRARLGGRVDGAGRGRVAGTGLVGGCGGPVGVGSAGSHGGAGVEREGAEVGCVCCPLVRWRDGQMVRWSVYLAPDMCRVSCWRRPLVVLGIFISRNPRWSGPNTSKWIRRRVRGGVRMLKTTDSRDEKARRERGKEETTRKRGQWVLGEFHDQRFAGKRWSAGGLSRFPQQQWQQLQRGRRKGKLSRRGLHHRPARSAVGGAMYVVLAWPWGSWLGLGRARDRDLQRLQAPGRTVRPCVGG